MISREAFEAWLSEHSSINMYVRVREVQGLPRYLRAKPHVVLQIGLNMPKPIPDLTVQNTRWFGTLSFGGKPFLVVCPFSAMIQIKSNDTEEMLFSIGPDGIREAVEEIVAAEERTEMPACAPIAPKAIPSAQADVICVDFRARRRVS